MSTEIELKLQLHPEQVASLEQHPLLRSKPEKTYDLVNEYYDTADLQLHQKRIAVRLRIKEGNWFCTVKTAEDSVAGLSTRNEWETLVPAHTLDFSHVELTSLRTFLEARIQQLKPVFSTNFRRRTWLVPVGSTFIELALDQGTIFSSHAQEPICEIELELISGNTADIFKLSSELSQTLDLEALDLSKADRGYSLISKNKNGAIGPI